MKSHLTRTWHILILWLSTACGNGSEQCEPPGLIACECPDGTASAQECRADGSLTACVCEGSGLVLRLVQIDRMQALGTTPVKQVTSSDGQTQWVPACSGDGTHVRLAFNLKSTSRPPGPHVLVRGSGPASGSDGTADHDLQVRAGDMIATTIIKPGETISASDFTVNLDCISEHDSSSIDTPTTPCAGTNEPNAATQDLEFVDHLNGSGRGTAVGVAFVIDQSGSIDGLVDGSLSPGALLPTCLAPTCGRASRPPSSLCRRCRSRRDT